MSSKNALNRPLFRNWSIARRLTLLYAGSSFLMLVLATTYLYWSLVDNLKWEDSAFLSDEIQEFRRFLNKRPIDKDLLAYEIQIEPAASKFIKYYVRLLDNQGRVLLETPRMADVLPVASFPAAIATTEIPTRGTAWKSGAGESYLLMSALAQVNMKEIAPQILQVALDVSMDEAAR
ncbi:MAG: hypothetical protein USCGTAYLOR_01176 [Chromatiales bacterium USCg_Taylor]|nr:MAG: hypothetical protein USCGTAYLOR_01176 [Chromatiales bacterium USCg_Taylor]